MTTTNPRAAATPTTRLPATGLEAAGASYVAQLPQQPPPPAQTQMVAVVIPCFNVAGQIGAVLRGMPSCVDHVIVIDDGCSDQTAAAVADVADTRIHLVTHGDNRGVGAATLSGWVQALALGAEVVVRLDGDGQMDAGLLPHFIETLEVEGADVVKGNRFADRKALRTMPAHRLIGNSCSRILAKAYTGYWHVQDPNSGYVALTRATIEALPLERLASGYFFENSLLAELNILGARLLEVPVPARYRGEPSHLSPLAVALQFPYNWLTGTPSRWWRKRRAAARGLVGKRRAR